VDKIYLSKLKMRVRKEVMNKNESLS